MKNRLYAEIVDTAMQIYVMKQYGEFGVEMIMEDYAFILGLGVLKLKKAVLTLVYNFLYNGNL